MDELKLLIEMVATLPQMALWVLVGFFVYKVVIIGSVFGILRLAIIKMHHWLTEPKKWLFADSVANDEVAHALHREIVRLRGQRFYIHMEDVERLRKAIDASKGM